MKTNITILAFTFIALNNINGQNVKEILSKTYDAQLAIQADYFERTKRMKSMTGSEILSMKMMRPSLHSFKSGMLRILLSFPIRNCQKHTRSAVIPRYT